MTISQDEQLSAFIDGEMPSNNQADLSANLLQDREFRQKMTRYQQIGETMRKQADNPVDASDIVSRIQADLDQEPYLLAPKIRRTSSTRSRIGRFAMGSGLAAAVAMLAIVIAPQLMNPHNPLAPEQTTVASVSAVTPQQATLVATQTQPAQRVSGLPEKLQRWKHLSPEQLQQLDSYLVEHNEYAGIVRVGRPSAQVNFVAIKNAHQ